jgi:hypothetical protein
MVFSLCSSAGVHGAFVRLFIAGGLAGELILGSSPAPAPDIVGAESTAPEARLLKFLLPVGHVVSRFKEGESEDPVTRSSNSERSARLDIVYRRGCKRQAGNLYNPCVSCFASGVSRKETLSISGG